MRAPVSSTRFYEDFKRSECYMPPLRLEEANDGTFLETSFEVQHGRINYRLKNTNTRSKEVWRYHSFDSYATFGQKKSTMIAALKKVDYFASDNSERMISAIHKQEPGLPEYYEARGMRNTHAGKR